MLRASCGPGRHHFLVPQAWAIALGGRWSGSGHGLASRDEFGSAPSFLKGNALNLYEDTAA